MRIAYAANEAETTARKGQAGAERGKAEDQRQLAGGGQKIVPEKEAQRRLA
jgi:hypothetical protein